MGTMTVFPAAGGEASPSAAAPQAVLPEGRLCAPPAYIQTSGDQTIPLTSENHKVAFGFIPEVDFALDSLSFYLTAVASQGNVSLGLHSDGLAAEPNGEFNGDRSNSAPSMTSNSSPSPYVVGMWDKNGANAETAGFQAYKAMDGLATADNGARSNAAPTASDPIYFTVDLGAGNEKAINRFRIISFSNSDPNIRAFPKTVTFWGSNLANPAVETDADWIQLTGSSPWTSPPDPYQNGSRDLSVFNSTPYRRYRWKITDRYGTNAYVGLGEVQLFEARQVSAPGSLLADLGQKAVGATADVWLRTEFEAFQLRRKTKYWVVFSGQAQKDFSLSKRRNYGATGSMFPDHCETKETTDGSAWTYALQNNRKALLNVVLNSTQRHVPQLLYGRSVGKRISLYGGGQWDVKEIPESGIRLNCEALPALEKHNVYVFDTGAALALEATVSPRDTMDGVEVKGSDPTRLFLGLIGLMERQPGYRGPFDVPDVRFIRNRYNTALKRLTKDPNYVGITRADHYVDAWDRLNHNDDFLLRLVSWDENALMSLFSPCSSSYGPKIGIGVDAMEPEPQNSFCPYQGGLYGPVTSLTTNVQLREGVHRMWFVVGVRDGTGVSYWLTTVDSPFLTPSHISGQIPC